MATAVVVAAVVVEVYFNEVANQEGRGRRGDEGTDTQIGEIWITRICTTRIVGEPG